MAEFWVGVECSFVELIKANTEEEAVKKATKKYRYGKGRLPREYVEVTLQKWDFVQVED